MSNEEQDTPPTTLPTLFLPHCVKSSASLLALDEQWGAGHLTPYPTHPFPSSLCEEFYILACSWWAMGSRTLQPYTTHPFPSSLCEEFCLSDNMCISCPLLQCRHTDTPGVWLVLGSKVPLVVVHFMPKRSKLLHMKYEMRNHLNSHTYYLLLFQNSETDFSTWRKFLRFNLKPTAHETRCIAADIVLPLFSVRLYTRNVIFCSDLQSRPCQLHHVNFCFADWVELVFGSIFLFLKRISASMIFQEVFTVPFNKKSRKDCCSHIGAQEM